MKRLITIFAAVAFAAQTWAYDFKSGDLYYNITSDTTVEVAYEIYADKNNYSGLTNAVIPETVTNNGVTTQTSGTLTLRIFASNDLDHWVELASLRGVPWKYYRFRYDFATLKATDRFAGTMLVTQERRTDKLR